MGTWTGKAKIKGRSATGVILGPEPAAMARDDRPADGQAHAQAVRLGAPERLEQAVELFRTDPCPWSLTLIRTSNRCAGCGSRRSARPGAFAHGVEGVQEEVEQHLLELDPVAPDSRQLGVELERERDPTDQASL